MRCIKPVAVLKTMLMMALAFGWMFAFLYLMFLTGEAIERNSDLERASYDIHCWHFIGLPFLTIVWGAIMAAVVMALIGAFDDDEDVYFPPVAMLLLLCMVAAWITMIVCGFQHPFTEFRQHKLAEDSVAKHEWGNKSFPISCTQSGAQPITLPSNAAYFLLEDPEWVPDFSAVKSRSEWGWTWAAVPFSYTGPVIGCSTTRPMYMLCIVKGSANEKSCNFEPAKRGSYTAIRRAHASHWIEGGELDEFDKFMSNADQDLYEYNVYDLQWMLEWINDSNHRWDHLRNAAYRGYLLATGIAMFVIFGVHIGMHDEYFTSPSTEKDSETERYEPNDAVAPKDSQDQNQFELATADDGPPTPPIKAEGKDPLASSDSLARDEV